MSKSNKVTMAPAKPNFWLFTGWFLLILLVGIGIGSFIGWNLHISAAADARANIITIENPLSKEMR